MMEQLTLFAGDSPASPLVSPGSAEARTMTVTSGQKCLPLLKSTGPVGLLARMLLTSSIWHSTTCFLTWKVKATKRKHLFFQLVPSTPRTDATDAGFWATPTVSRGGNYGTGSLKLPGQVKLWPTPTASIAKGTSQAALVRKDGKSRAADRLDHSINPPNNTRREAKNQTTSSTWQRGCPANRGHHRTGYSGG